MKEGVGEMGREGVCGGRGRVILIGIGNLIKGRFLQQHGSLVEQQSERKQNNLQRRPTKKGRLIFSLSTNNNSNSSTGNSIGNSIGI